MFSAPQPRARLYTRTSAYLRVGRALAGFGGWDKGVDALERALERMHPGYRTVAMPMARVGIYLTIKHTIRPGQAVILSPYTISDVVNMVLCAGGVPVFVDTELNGSCNIDPAALRRALDSTPNVGAVLVTHFYGLICDIQPIVEVCRSKGIPLIEDAAQAFGATFGGTRAGAFADAGVLSFGLLKHVTGFLGGAVLTRDEALERRLRDDLAQLALVPRKTLLKKVLAGAQFDFVTRPLVFDSLVYWLFRHAYLHNVSFFNNKLDTDRSPVAYSALPAKYAGRMSSAQAEVIVSQFSTFEEDARERIAKARIYYEGLQGIPGLTLPPMREDGSHIYLYYSALARERDALALSMTRELRDVQISHHRNCASLECFAAYRRDCPNAEYASQTVIYLPLYPGYRKEQVMANIDAIRHFYMHRRPS